MSGKSKAWLVYNGASGSHEEGKESRLVEALSAAGLEVDRAIDCHQATVPDAAEATRLGLTHVVVHGGDGTINSTISGLEGWDGAVLSLPGGTANLLCHRLFDECDAFGIIERFGAGELVPRRITCVRGRETLALSELLAGPGARWADVREEMRDFHVGEMVAKSVDAASESTSGPMVRLADPDLGKTEGYAGVRLSPFPDGMAVQGFGTDGLAEFLQQGIAILLRDFREGPHDELGRVDAVTCVSTEGASIPLMADGERIDGADCERFELAELDVDLLGPADG